MSQIEREIKILDIDVQKVISVLKNKGIVPKGKYIQDVYTFDLPSINQLYLKYIDNLANGDKRGIQKLVREVRPCFSKKDLETIKNIIGTEDMLQFICTEKSDIQLLKSQELIQLMERTNDNFSKWIRLRQTGDQTTITIKKIVDSKGEYELDAVEELEFDVPDILTGKQFLEDLGYFFARHQIKMRIAYDYKNTEIVIDKWPQLPPYIEVEGPSENEIIETVEMLGYSKDDVTVINTDDIYLRHNIDIYAKENNDLSFSEEEQKEVKKYLES